VQRAKLCVEIGAIVLLILLNIRGVKESVTTILPVFMAFVVTHVVLLGVSIGATSETSARSRTRRSRTSTTPSQPSDSSPRSG